MREASNNGARPRKGQNLSCNRAKQRSVREASNSGVKPRKGQKLNSNRAKQRSVREASNSCARPMSKSAVRNKYGAAEG